MDKLSKAGITETHNNTNTNKGSLWDIVSLTSFELNNTSATLYDLQPRLPHTQTNKIQQPVSGTSQQPYNDRRNTEESPPYE